MITTLEVLAVLLALALTAAAVCFAGVVAIAAARTMTDLWHHRPDPTEEVDHDQAR
jgi:hypothetical protein